jgi:hypothetical protein
MHKNKIIIFYLLLLLLHVAHVFEEVWARFWIMDSIFGVGWFLIINWLLLCIPVVLFYYVLKEKRLAYILSFFYASLMFLNGLGHNIATIVTGKYFGGFAGGFTGIGFIIIAPALIYYLLKDIKKFEFYKSI